MNKFFGRALAATAVVAVIATAAPMSAFAATEPMAPSTSDAPVYVVNGGTGVSIPAATQLSWSFGETAVLSGKATTATPTNWDDLLLPAPANGATDYVTFLSDPGSERTPSAWKGSADSAPFNGNVGALMPDITPSSFIYGTGMSGVKSNGGTFSAGVAYTKNNGQTVVSAYYTTINVDAGGTWTFATPAGVCTDPTVEHTTTTSLTATPDSVEAGKTTTLEATVTSDAAVAGNVEFYEGTNKIGTVALANGAASKVVTVGTVGTHTYSAKFVENTVDGCPVQHFAASTSANVTAIGTEPVVPVPPNAATEDALNANSANGATATYDEATHTATLHVDAANESKIVNMFAYSTPTYLGQQVVSGGVVTANVSTLAQGDHKLAIADPSTGDVLAWASFTKTDAAIDPSFSKTINADVAALAPSDGEFSLINTSGSSVNLTNPVIVNGQSVVSGELGTFKVTDMRQVSKPGWSLSTTVADFTKGTDTIAASALGFAPKVVSQAGTGATAPTLGSAQVSGSASYPWNFATLASGAFSGVSTYNADLVFTAPAGKPAGTYSSTITLTLVSN